MNTRRKIHEGKRFSQHHEIEVMANIEWHLANLWEGGWKTIRLISQDEHRIHHANKKKEPRGKSVKFGNCVLGEWR